MASLKLCGLSEDQARVILQNMDGEDDKPSELLMTINFILNKEGIKSIQVTNVDQNDRTFENEITFTS